MKDGYLRMWAARKCPCWRPTFRGLQLDLSKAVPSLEYRLDILFFSWNLAKPRLPLERHPLYWSSKNWIASWHCVRGTNSFLSHQINSVWREGRTALTNRRAQVIKIKQWTFSPRSLDYVKRNLKNTKYNWNVVTTNNNVKCAGSRTLDFVSKNTHRLFLASC